MTKDGALKMALEVLELWHNAGEAPSWYGRQDRIDAMNAIRQALAEPDMGIDRGAWDGVPDATKWVDELRGGDEEPPNSTTDVVEPEKPELWFNGKAMYSAPPKREWVGLTDEEEIELDETYGDDFNAYIDARDAKLRAKNGF